MSSSNANVAQRLTFVTRIGVSHKDYSRWVGGFKSTDTERAIQQLFGPTFKRAPSVHELMYVLCLVPRLIGNQDPAVVSVRARVDAMLQAGTERDKNQEQLTKGKEEE